MNVLDQKQWDEFVSKGLPTRRDERWKYTDVSFLADKKYAAAKRLDAEYLRDKVNQCRLPDEDIILLVFVNGYFFPTLSDLAKLPEGVIACSLNQALIDRAGLVKEHWFAGIDAKRYPFARLNTTMFNDGLFLFVPDDCHLSKPIHLLSIVEDEKEFVVQPHHLLALGSHSQVTLFEEHISFTPTPYMVNMVTTIMLNAGASLQHYKIQTENTSAVHMANTFVRQNKDSRAAFTTLSKGAWFARDDLVIKLQETGAECQTAGFYHLQRDDQYVDHHVDITHSASHSQSEMVYKGILDKKSQAVFNGRLCIEKNAQKTLAHQANHNLLLTNNAQVYTKPELEIDADDVKCKHGATTGCLNEEAIFYLRSRGISRDDAITMLLQGFADEIIQRITHPVIKQRVQKSIR